MQISMGKSTSVRRTCPCTLQCSVRRKRLRPACCMGVSPTWRSIPSQALSAGHCSRPPSKPSIKASSLGILSVVLTLGALHATKTVHRDQSLQPGP